MVRTILPLLALGATLFAACNCSEHTNGYIYDLDDKTPINNVYIRSYAAMDNEQMNQRATYTDSNGYFETYYAVKSVAKCPILKLEIAKAGYDTTYHPEHKVGDTIFLRKVQQ